LVKAALLTYRLQGFPGAYQMDRLTFEAIVVETSPSLVKDAVEVMHGVFLGEPPDCEPRSAPRAAVGGTENLVQSEAIAERAGELGIADLGFNSWIGDGTMSDKSTFPTHLRARPSWTSAARYLVRLVKDQVGLPGNKALIWYCDEDSGYANVNASLEEAQAVGLDLQAVHVSTAGAGVFPPDDQAWRQGWSDLVQFANQVGARTHILAMSDGCPRWDFMSYMATQGLVGSTYLWTGVFDFGEANSSYHERAELYRTVGSPYAAVSPLDGFFFLSPDDFGGALAANFTAWFYSELGGRRSELLEEWANEYVSADAFNVSFLAEHLQEFRAGYYFVDALYAAQLAASAAFNAHGEGFTNSQLFEKLKLLDFNGLSGRVAFDASGDRLISYRAAQYLRQDACPAPSSGRRLAVAGMSELRPRHVVRARRNTMS